MPEKMMELMMLTWASAPRRLPTRADAKISAAPDVPLSTSSFTGNREIAVVGDNGAHAGTRTSRAIPIRRRIGIRHGPRTRRSRWTPSRSTRRRCAYS